MIIRTKYQDSSGNIENQAHSMTRLSFIKHAAIAGQGYAPRLHKIRRIIGAWFWYQSYLNRDDFYNHNRFSQPQIRFSDPTEKGFFSNIAGKAISDFLSKRIHRSILTVNYEAAMRIKGHKIKGSRPDLIAFQSSRRAFAIESKGYDKSSISNMTNHKNQSASGPISLNFSVASVSYNLYNDVHCNYYDPVLPEAEFDDDLLRTLSKKYYSGFKEFVDERYFNKTEVEYNNERFIEIEIFTERFLRSNYLSDDLLIPFRFLYEIISHPGFRLLVPQNIEEICETGLNLDTEPFIMSEDYPNDLYIDNDRIGLKINRFY
ncbi:MAG: hypothetical protein J5I91_05555 [Bacteroidetes bacterium]|nr:hypothetical protein [Bacteroidota bacterium]